MNTIGYDFKDFYLPFRGLSFAVRLATEENLYAPDLKAVHTQERGNYAGFDAAVLSSAGGQLIRSGEIRLSVRQYPDKRIGITAGANIPDERCKSILILIKGIDVRTFSSESENMGERVFDEKNGVGPISYPGRESTMPLIFAGTGETEWFVISKDKEVRKKSFASYYDDLCGEKILVLAHEEDARKVGNSIELPEWQIGSGFSRQEVVRERCADLEKNLGLKPFCARNHSPLFEEIKMVVNFHGEHWTGHLFNSFDDMSRKLRWICRYTAGRNVLAFLPAWDGRYYCRYPEHLPSERMGGEEGLKNFVKTAHALGTKVVLMLGGPNLASFDFLKSHDLMEAAMKTRWGTPILQDWVDWDGDLSRECVGYVVNFGHPGYRRYMVKTVSRLFDEYGVDGVFLDGAIRWENCSDYSPYEGITEFVKEIRSKYPERILMGEDGYDAIWGLFDLFATSWQPLGLEYAMLRYTRQSYYLSHPAENGSGGVHEQAWHSDTAEKAIPQYTIPALSVVDEEMETHGKELRDKIRQYTEWNLELPEITR